MLLHVGVALILAFASHVRVFEPAPEQTVEVEILTLPRLEPPVTQPRIPLAPVESPGSTLPSGARVPAPEPPGNAGPSPTMIDAARLLSTGLLADPRSRRARDALSHFAGEERIEQLCGIEAMAQIAAWNRAFQPDRVIAYALGDTKPVGRDLIADGAAFHSKGQWFSLRFRCGLTPDARKVVAFRFAVGTQIPRREWSAHNLPTEALKTD